MAKVPLALGLGLAFFQMVRARYSFRTAHMTTFGFNVPCLLVSLVCLLGFPGKLQTCPIFLAASLFRRSVSNRLTFSGQSASLVGEVNGPTCWSLGLMLWENNLASKLY